MWVFGKTGRPAALLELYQGSQTESAWVHAICLTQAEPVVLKRDRDLWTPKSAPLSPQRLGDADLPDRRDAVRLRQMQRAIARMSAHEFWEPNNSRYELRSLPRPVHRYRDESQKIYDGAVFIFAHGTNPEIAVLIEAWGPSRDEARWHFAAAPLGSAELHLMQGDTELWKVDRALNVAGRVTDPYHLFVVDVK